MRIRPEFKGAALALLAVLLLLAGVWVGFGLRLGIWNYHDYDTYLWVTRGTRVGHNLWWGKVTAGDDVERIIEGYAPHRVWRFGRWVNVGWTPGGPLTHTNAVGFIGVSIIAKDGVLVQGVYYSDWGPDGRTFFNRLTSAEQANFYADRDAFLKDLIKHADSPGEK